MWIVVNSATGEQIGGLQPTEPTPQPGQIVQLVPQSTIEGLTQWSPQAKGFVDAPPATPPPPDWQICVNFHADATANLTLTNLASAAAFLAGSNRNIELIDMARFTQACLRARVLTAGTASSKLCAVYAGSLQGAIGSYLDLGASPIEASIATVGIADSGWINLAPAAIADGRFVTIRQQGGDGVADPALGRVTLWLR